MPSPRSSLLDRSAEAAPGAPPEQPALPELRPRTPAEICDAAFNLLRARPALLGPLGSLHLLPLGAAAAALVFLPGRAFPVRHPSLPLAFLALVAAAALALRPLALGAVAVAVATLVRGEEAEPLACLRVACRRALDLLGGAARAAALDLVTLGFPRLAGVHHTVAPLVALEGRGPAGARSEASRLAGAFSHAHALLNAHHLLAYLAVAMNLDLGAILGIELLRALLGLDLAFARRFVSPQNLSFHLLVLPATWALLEPLRAVTKALLLLDLRLREEGTDLKLRLGRLG